MLLGDLRRVFEDILGSRTKVRVLRDAARFIEWVRRTLGPSG